MFKGFSYLLSLVYLARYSFAQTTTLIPIPHAYFEGLQADENFVASVVSVVGTTTVFDVVDFIGTTPQFVFTLSVASPTVIEVETNPTMESAFECVADEEDEAIVCAASFISLDATGGVHSTEVGGQATLVSFPVVVIPPTPAPSPASITSKASSPSFSPSPAPVPTTTTSSASSNHPFASPAPSSSSSKPSSAVSSSKSSSTAKPSSSSVTPPKSSSFSPSPSGTPSSSSKQSLSTSFQSTSTTVKTSLAASASPSHTPDPAPINVLSSAAVSSAIPTSQRGDALEAGLPKPPPVTSSSLQGDSPSPVPSDDSPSPTPSGDSPSPVPSGDSPSPTPSGDSSFSSGPKTSNAAGSDDPNNGADLKNSAIITFSGTTNVLNIFFGVALFLFYF